MPGQGGLCRMGQDLVQDSLKRALCVRLPPLHLSIKNFVIKIFVFFLIFFSESCCERNVGIFFFTSKLRLHRSPVKVIGPSLPTPVQVIGPFLCRKSATFLIGTYSLLLRTGPARTTMSCGCWRAFVTQPVSPLITSGCSRVRATAAPISKSATSAWRSRPICWWTSRHDFIGACHIGQNQGQLRNPDKPDHILESAAADKIRNYRDTYRRNRHVAFLPACMSTSGRIHGERLRLIFFLSNKQADDYFAALGYQPHKQEFCHRRGVFFQQNRGTIPGCGVAWRPHHRASPRRCPSPPAAPPHGLR
jgi:hypothetical protein